MKSYIKFFFLIGISSLSGYSQNLTFSGGSTFSVMMCSNGEVYTMGSNTLGQLGTNGVPAFSINPIKVLRGAQPVSMNDGTNLGSIKQVDAGSGGHAVSLACDGTVWCWGWNAFGQLGDNTTVNANAPVQVLTGAQGDASGFLQNALMVTGGNLNSYAVLADRRVVAWGYNTKGQIGDGTLIQRNIPVYVLTGPGTYLDQVIQIEGGDDFAVALRADGTVWTWGNNANGQLGQNNTTDYTYATQVFQDAARTTPLVNIVKLTAGDTHVLALVADGTLKSWGGNWAGQLGHSSGGLLPGVVLTAAGGSALTGVVAISGGNRHSMAVLNDGTLVTWGGNGAGNYFGQTGTGAGSDYPATVPTLANIIDVSDGDLWTFAVNGSGTVYAFGKNTTDGLLGVGSSAATEPTPLAVTLPCSLAKTCPDAYLGADVALCNPVSTTLYATASAVTVKYRWKKDGVLLPDTLSSLFVNSPGTYRLIMWDSSYVNSCGYCAPDSDEVVITTAAPTIPNNAYFCAPPDQEVDLSVTGTSGNNFDWYAASTGGAPLNGAPSSSFTTPLINSTTTYYAQDRASYNYSVGYSIGGAGLTSASNDWYTNSFVGMKFDALSAFNFDTVTVNYPTIPSAGECCCGNLTWSLQIDIYNSANVLIGTKITTVPCVINTTVKIPLNIAVPAGTDHSIKFGGVADQFLTYHAGATYPKSVAGIISIKSTTEPAAWAAAWWGAFYDWKISSLNGCGRIPVQAILNCPLPVQFEEFNAAFVNGRVLLKWITSFEKNNHLFSVQRSSDGVNFETIGKVDGGGTTTFNSSYAYTDQNPLSGISYYRIQQNDFDGNSSNSEVKVLSINATHAILFPNPFSDKINVQVFSDAATTGITIMDMTGKVLSQKEIQSNTEYYLGEELAPGMYLVRIFTNYGEKFFKVEKLK